MPITPAVRRHSLPIDTRPDDPARRAAGAVVGSGWSSIAHGATPAHSTLAIDSASPLDASAATALRRTIDARIEPHAQLLRDAVAQRRLRVPDTFIHAGTDRQAEYAATLLQGLAAFRESRIDQLIDGNVDASRLHDVFEQAARKDGWMGFAAAAVDRIPQAVTIAATAYANAWTQAASKADPTKGPAAAALVGGLTNLGAGVVHSHLGPYMKSAVQGRDPYYAQPPRRLLHPAVGAVLDALPADTLGARLRTGFHASRGMDYATLASEAVGIAATASGAHHQTAVDATITTKLLAQPLLTGWVASQATQQSEAAAGRRGDLLLLGREDWRECADRAMKPLLSWENAAQAGRKAARVVASPAAFLLPPAWVNDAMDLPMPPANARRPAFVERLMNPFALLGSLGYAGAGVVAGAGNGGLNRRYGVAPTGDTLGQTGNNVVRSTYNSAMSLFQTLAYMGSNTAATVLGSSSTAPARPAAAVAPLGGAADEASAANAASVPTASASSPVQVGPDHTIVRM